MGARKGRNNTKTFQRNSRNASTFRLSNKAPRAGSQILPVSTSSGEEREPKTRVSRAIGNLKGSAVVFQPQTIVNPWWRTARASSQRKSEAQKTGYAPYVIRVGMENAKAMRMTRGD